MVDVAIRYVQLFAARVDQRRVALVRHYANNLAPLSLIRANAKQDLLTHSRFVRKCFCRESLIDDEYVPIRCAVFLGEGSSLQKSRTHRFKVAGQNYLEIGSLKLCGVLQRLFFAPSDGTKSCCQR